MLCVSAELNRSVLSLKTHMTVLTSISFAVSHVQFTLPHHRYGGGASTSVLLLVLVTFTHGRMARLS